MHHKQVHSACLLQEGQLVAFASRKLIESECNLAQVEKELLAIVYGVTRFHEWIFGYHKPLVPLMKICLGNVASSSLKRLRPNCIIHMHLADLLSRLYLKDQVADDTEIDQMVHSVSTHLAITPSRRVQFEKETVKDIPCLGCQEHKKQANQIVHSYWPIRHYIFPEENLLLYKDMVIVPTKLRPQMLSLVHGHGTVASWEHHVLARFGKGCKNVCQAMEILDIPTLPYEYVSADILAFGCKNFLIITDAYSKWVGIVPLPGKNVESVVDACTTVFVVHGDPQILVTDNIPFNSREFRNFAKD
ncbi:hypothetical protein PR048_023693 [Dryococelus australis]|uniref:Integrase catalytic domain-containing protein n=1 Tax=Dryococelus australis TaxID=614101 RepID=A0ABQ9GUT0_9NEOP|nr:hypothetical protein PR048_023693 [Dryococelus australis]